MSFKEIKKYLLLSISFIATPIFAQSMQALEAKKRSLEACRQSIKHNDCNLKILDKDLQDSLIKLDQYQQLRENQNRRDKAVSTVSGSIQFSTTTISEVNDEIVKMLGGSTWKLSRSYFGLPLNDVIIVMTDQRNGVLYSEDSSYRATLLSGSIQTASGQIRTVVEKMGEGTILKLDDGTLLEFSSYDKYHTGWWLPPYRVILDSSRMNMWNIDKAKKVWVQRVLN